MLACWKNLTEQQRCIIAALIVTFPGQWSKENVKELLLLPEVKFDDIKKLRGCHIISKEDPSVFVTPVFNPDDEEDDQTESTGQRFGRFDDKVQGQSKGWCSGR
jgi:hypothetical protein